MNAERYASPGAPGPLVGLPPTLRDDLAAEPPAVQADLARTWALLDHLAPSATATTATDVAWRRLAAALPPDEPSIAARPADDRLAPRRAAPVRAAVRPTGRRARPLAWLAPTALLLVAVFGVGIYWSQPITQTAAPGATARVTLPDGSTVHLNSGSAIQYARNFERLPFVAAATREVRLAGEAYFDVQHGDTPFVVQSFNADVRVYGTAFNVRAWRDAGETVVTLERGRVALTSRAAVTDEVVDEVLLAPGQAARVVGAEATPTAPAPAAVEQALAWRADGFAVSNQPLRAVFAELERRYGVTITVAPEVATTAPLTLYFPQPSGVQAILDDLCAAQNLRYRATSRGFEVYR